MTYNADAMGTLFIANLVVQATTTRATNHNRGDTSPMHSVTMFMTLIPRYFHLGFPKVTLTLDLTLAVRDRII